MDESTTGSGDRIMDTAPTAPIVGRITQLTEAKTVTMYPLLERREWIFGTALDPRDVRIAELEAALREIEHWCEIAIVPYLTLKAIRERAAGALVPPPERDMTITQEAMDA